MMQALKGQTRKITRLVRRGVLRRVDTSAASARFQVQPHRNDLMDDVPFVQNAGVSAAPVPGQTNVILLSGGGDATLTFAIAADSQKRPRGQAPGSLVLYDPASASHHIRLLPSGGIEVESATKIILTAPEVEVVGPTRILGDVEIEGKVKIKGDLDVTGATTLKATKINGVPQIGS